MEVQGRRRKGSLDGWTVQGLILERRDVWGKKFMTELHQNQNFIYFTHIH